MDCVSLLILGDLVIGSPEWVAPALILGTFLTFLVLWNYFRSASIYRYGALGVLLKLIAIALMAVCLVEPMRRATRPRPRANLLPIVIDTSRSMDLAIGRSESWRDRIDETFAPESPVLAAMSQSFDTRVYGFDKRLASASEVAELDRGGRASRLIAALSELSDRLAERPVAGVLLVSDGNDPSALSEGTVLPELPFPVYPVKPSGFQSGDDVRLTGTSIRQTNFELSPVTVTARFAVEGEMRGTAKAALVDVDTDTILEEKSIRLDGAEEKGSVTFQFRPLDVGLRFYRINLFRETDRTAFDQPDKLIRSPSSEMTLVNNTQLIAVDRGRGPYRVLYVSGRPNWEFKFLKRAVEEDSEVELRGLIRMANKKPKFSFRDRDVSDTNPLFQGLGDDAEETAEQYDEPVMIRVGIKTPDELASGFPKTADELFWFDALILDDIEPKFFSRDQLSMIRQFVSSRGGGLMLLGGQEMFGGKSFAESILGELSPVYMTRSGDGNDGPFSLGLTREGLLQPWMRLRDNATQETVRLRRMPEFASVNEVGELKAGAYQFATVTNDMGDLKPAIAVHRFGKGKVGAITITDLWRWSMRRDPENEDDASQAWRQAARWLVSDVPRRATISAHRHADDTDRVTVRIDAKDEEYLPLDNASVELVVTGPDGKSLPMDTKQVDDSAGAYEVDYYAESPGSYSVAAMVRSPDGELISELETGWTRQIAGREFDQLGTNESLLQQIADESGGAVIKEEDLDGFVSRLEATKVPVTETWVYPLWHRGWVIALALGCLCTEWGLRRWRGLP